MERTSPWRFGIFFYDRDDQRLWVPKRVAAMGWTLNFAHPASWIVLAVIVAAIMALTVARRT